MGRSYMILAVRYWWFWSVFRLPSSIQRLRIGGPLARFADKVRSYNDFGGALLVVLERLPSPVSRPATSVQPPALSIQRLSHKRAVGSIRGQGPLLQ